MNDLVPQQRLDISQFDSFELPKELITLEGFELFDYQAVLAAGDVIESTTRLAFHVHIIMKYKLWRFPKLPNGAAKFDTQQEYLDDLQSRCLFASSTMKNYHAALKMAAYLGYNTMAQVEERGIWVFEAVKRQVKTDQDTGKPLRLLRGQLPKGKSLDSFLVEAIEAFGGGAGSQYQFSDLRREVERALSPGRPIVEFSIPNQNQPWKVQWHVEMYKDQMLVMIEGNHGYLDNGFVPDYVWDEWYRKLGVDRK